jgi:hypothetical protein
MSDNPYLRGAMKPFPVPRLGNINPYLGRDPSPFPVNRANNINPQHQPSRAQAEPIWRDVKTEATVVIAARARRGRRQTQRLKANGNQVAEA